MRTACNRRMRACEPVWRLTGVTTRKGPTILHPHLSQIRVKSPSSWEKVIPQQTMNYLQEVLRSLPAHHPRTTQRLSPKRDPPPPPHRSNRSISGVRRLVRRETSIDRRPSELAPEYMPIRPRGMAPQFPLVHHPFGVTYAPHLVSFLAVQGIEDMLSSPLGPHILSYKPPRGFVMPSFAMYDGSTDPYDHMLHFN